MEEALRRLRALQAKTALVFDIIERQWSAKLHRHDDAYDAERISYFRTYHASNLTASNLLDNSNEIVINDLLTNEERLLI